MSGRTLLEALINVSKREGATYSTNSSGKLPTRWLTSTRTASSFSSIKSNRLHLLVLDWFRPTSPSLRGYIANHDVFVWMKTTLSFFTANLLTVLP